MRSFLRGFATQARQMLWPSRYFILLLMLFGVSFMSMGIYDHYVVRDMPLAILDFDHSKISRSIAEFLSATREVRIVDSSTINSPEEAIAKMDRGELVAVIIIPHDLSKKVKSGKLATLPVYIDMSNILTGKNIYKPIAKAIGTVAAGVQLQLVKKQGERKDKALSRVVPVSVVETFAFNPATNYVIYIVPGLLFYFFGVYLVILAGSIYIGKPPILGALDIVGRCTALWVWGVLLGSFFIWVMMPLSNIVTETPPDLILTILGLFVLASILLAGAFYSLYRIPLLALQTAIICAMLSLMLSGITWPTDTFPPILRAISFWIPFTYFAKAYQSFLHYPLTAEDMAWFIDGLKTQILVFSGVIVFGLVLHGLKRRLIKRKGAVS